MDELIVQKNVFDRIEFTIGIGNAARGDIDQLKSSLKAAEMAVQQRLIEGTEKLIENVPTKRSGEAAMVPGRAEYVSGTTREDIPKGP